MKAFFCLFLVSTVAMAAESFKAASVQPSNIACRYDESRGVVSFDGTPEYRLADAGPNAKVEECSRVLIAGKDFITVTYSSGPIVSTHSKFKARSLDVLLLKGKSWLNVRTQSLDNNNSIDSIELWGVSVLDGAPMIRFQKKDKKNNILSDELTKLRDLGDGELHFVTQFE